MSRTVWYLPLEIYPERYTEQLRRWILSAFEAAQERLPHTMRMLAPYQDEEAHIAVGQVLDATRRAAYCLRQIDTLIERIADGRVLADDIIYLQDYTTFGIDAVLYALHQHGLHIPVFAMMHANTVDPADFTYPMRDWLRHYEKGLDAYMERHGGGIFVASNIHKRQLRDAGFKAPIHVVSLPIDAADVRAQVQGPVRKDPNLVIHSSRLDPEKNPGLLVKVINLCMKRDASLCFCVTTSALTFRGDATAIADLRRLAKGFPERVLLREGITKQQYYELLAKAQYQINCGWQDYVSWTMLEADVFQCRLLYPDHGSFLECLPIECRVFPDAEAYATRLCHRIAQPTLLRYIADHSDRRGRRRLPDIMLANRFGVEYDIWARKD